MAFAEDRPEQDSRFNPDVSPGVFQMQGLSQAQPPTYLEAFKSGELEAQIKPQGYWEQLMALGKQGAANSTFTVPFASVEGADARWLAQRNLRLELEAEGAAKYTAEEANTHYPGMTVPFKEPIHPQLAQLMYDSDQEAKIRAEWVARGPYVNPIIASLAESAPQMIAPANIALMAAGGAVTTKIFGKAAPLWATYVDNLANILATEGIGYAQKSKEQDISVGEVVGGAFAGAAIGTTLHAATSKLFGLLNKAEKEIPSGVKNDGLNTGVAQHEGGARVDVEPIMDNLNNKRSGEPHITGTSSYVFREQTHPSESPYYSGLDGSTGGSVGSGETFYPGGVEHVDNEQVMHNLASDPEGAFTGKVIKSEVSPDAKFLDLEQSVKTPEGKAVARLVLKALGVDSSQLNDMIHEGATLKDIFRMAKDADSPEIPALQIAKDTVQEMGFQGYKKVNEVNGMKHNAIEVFSEDHMRNPEVFDAVKDNTPRMGTTERRQAFEESVKPENSRINEPGLDEKVAKQTKDQTVLKLNGEVDPEVQAVVESTKARLNDMAVDEPAVGEALAAIEEAHKMDLAEIEPLQKYADCIANEMV